MNAIFDKYKAPLEALIFTSPSPLTVEEITDCLSAYYDHSPVTIQETVALLDQLYHFYTQNNFGFELIKSAGGYQFYSKPEYQSVISLLLQQNSKKKLSTTILETLSIVAYKQPVTKSEIEHIRGVNCDYAIQKLLDKNLITIKGKSNDPGRPLLYATSVFFMEYFGINDIKDLPQLKDLRELSNQIGENKHD